MKCYCKKCKGVTKHKKAPMGTRCVICHELDYEQFTALEELERRKYNRFESRVKEMD